VGAGLPAMGCSRRLDRGRGRSYRILRDTDCREVAGAGSPAIQPGLDYFSTFHITGIPVTIRPFRLARYAIGQKNWPKFTYGDWS
jgi:hypothetical protein